MNTQLWEKWTRFNLEFAQLIRACQRHEAQLLLHHGWAPFPQSSCSFTFGTRRRALPVGALLLLWKKHPEFTIDCTSCGGRAHAHRFVGLLSIGQMDATCAKCGLGYTRRVGGIGALYHLIGPALKETEYRVTGGSLGGCIRGPRKPLWQALYKLGERDLPSRQWITAVSEPEVFMRIGDTPAQFPFNHVIARTRKG